MERPPIEKWIQIYKPFDDDMCRYEKSRIVRVCNYALDLERKNAAYDKANKSFQELLITANKERADLESRLKEAEEACGDAVVFIKAHPICVDLMPFTAAHIAKKLEKALKDLGKDKP